MNKTASQIADEVLTKCGFVKLAGYWQNVVGFDDEETFSKLRQKVIDAQARAQQMENEKAKYLQETIGQRPFSARYNDAASIRWREKERKAIADWNRTSDYADADLDELIAMENFTPESFGGKDLGDLQKYQYVTPMVAGTEYGDPQGKGYMTREEIQSHLGEGYQDVPESTRTALERAPYKYYTSLSAG